MSGQQKSWPVDGFAFAADGRIEILSIVSGI